MNSLEFRLQAVFCGDTFLTCRRFSDTLKTCRHSGASVLLTEQFFRLANDRLSLGIPGPFRLFRQLSQAHPRRLGLVLCAQLKMGHRKERDADRVTFARYVRAAQ